MIEKFYKKMSVLINMSVYFPRMTPEEVSEITMADIHESDQSGQKILLHHRL
jgi:hypothetical protein